MSRVLTDSLTHAYAKCENHHLCFINDHFSKTKTFCFINQNPLDKLRYSLVFIKSRVFLWVANFRGPLDTRIFHFLFLLCGREIHFGCCPILPSPPSNTKHSINLYHTLTPMSCDVPCINAMQCHCMYLMLHAQ